MVLSFKPATTQNPHLAHACNTPVWLCGDGTSRVALTVLALPFAPTLRRERRTASLAQQAPVSTDACAETKVRRSCTASVSVGGGRPSESTARSNCRPVSGERGPETTPPTSQQQLAGARPLALPACRSEARGPGCLSVDATADLQSADVPAEGDAAAGPDGRAGCRAAAAGEGLVGAAVREWSTSRAGDAPCRCPVRMYMQGCSSMHTRRHMHACPALTCMEAH
eukprot:169895-Chlamydomonas_euryale.AAC.4